MNRCILGEINEKTYILAKSPKVHKGGGSTPQPIGGYSPLLNGPASRDGVLLDHNVRGGSVSWWIGRLPMQLSQTGLATKLLHLWSCGLWSAVLVRELAI